RIASPRSGIVLFNPEITVVAAAGSTATHLIATAAEPALRPEAVQTQIDAARSLLSSLADPRGALPARAAAGGAMTRPPSPGEEGGDHPPPRELGAGARVGGRGSLSGGRGPRRRAHGHLPAAQRLDGGTGTAMNYSSNVFYLPAHAPAPEPIEPPTRWSIFRA